VGDARWRVNAAWTITTTSIAARRAIASVAYHVSHSANSQRGFPRGISSRNQPSEEPGNPVSGSVVFIGHPQNFLLPYQDELFLPRMAMAGQGIR